MLLGSLKGETANRSFPSARQGVLTLELGPPSGGKFRFGFSVTPKVTFATPSSEDTLLSPGYESKTEKRPLDLSQ
jgi:hypothetical protein